MVWLQEPLLTQEAADDAPAPAPRSTWRNLSAKMKMLLPFMWPKNNIALQILVLLCVMLLVAGRVVNLFTPILYKYIGSRLLSNACSVHTVKCVVECENLVH